MKYHFCPRLRFGLVSILTGNGIAARLIVISTSAKLTHQPFCDNPRPVGVQTLACRSQAGNRQNRRGAGACRIGPGALKTGVSRSGGIGRRARFRTWWGLTPWRFKSSLRHFFRDQPKGPVEATGPFVRSWVPGLTSLRVSLLARSGVRPFRECPWFLRVCWGRCVSGSYGLAPQNC